jgi:dihydroorotase-like cyclic amidohydrolase
VRQVSTAGGIAYLREAKRSWDKQTLLAVEVTPQQLFATADVLERLGPSAAVFPPLRDTDDGDALWEGIADGTVDFVATDHAPHAAEEKERGREDIWATPTGIPGLETFVPLLLDACFSGRLSLTRLVELTARAPARVHSFYPRKGTLLPGADADLMVVDPGLHWTIDQSRVYTRAGYSIFEGRQGRGWPVLTMVRGIVVAREGRPVVDEAVGQLVVGHAAST